MDEDKEVILPYTEGDKLVLVVTVEDATKSFDFLGKCVYNKTKLLEEVGLKFEKVSFKEDRYRDNLSNELKDDICEILNEAYSKISNKLKGKK